MIKFINSKKVQGGFTLIETMVYLALFAIMFGGSIAVAYNVIESSGRNQTKSVLQEEGDFLFAKVGWMLSGAKLIDISSLPADGVIHVCNTGRPLCLSVTKFNGAVYNVSLVAPTQTPLCSNTDNGSLLFWQSPNCPVPLNNSNVQIKSLAFTHYSASGDGINPESVKMDLTLSALTPNGSAMSEDFSETNYLRK